MDNGLLERSLSSVRSLIGLQLVSRLFTFVLNQGLVRLASPQAYGTVAVQFELLMSTILFLSREGVRNSLLRVWPQKSDASESKLAFRAIQCANLSTVPALLGMPVTFATVLTYIYVARDDARHQPYFFLALLIYTTAAVIELCSEPMHNRAMGTACTDIRVRAEGLGITSKTMVAYLALLYDSYLGSQNLTLLAFALGQLAYSVVVFSVYMANMPDTRLWPIRLPKVPSESPVQSRPAPYLWLAEFFDPNSFRLSASMTLQSIIKHFLTEGDKFLVSYWSPLEDQGGYAIAVNYGSLIARIAFQPIEEMCRVYFSRVLSPSDGSLRSKPDNKSNASSALKQASDAITTLLSVQITLSIIVVTFGSLYLPVVMQVLLPRQYLSTSAPEVLTAWIWYIPFLAVNGGLEAFQSSVATPGDLRRQSWWMLVYSVVYTVSAISFYHLGFGDASLVYANIVNLSARITYCIVFTLGFFERNSSPSPFYLVDVFPDWRFLAANAVSYLLISFNESRQGIMELSRSRSLFSTSLLLHISLGAGLGLICMAVWWTTSGNLMVTKLKRKVA